MPVHDPAQPFPRTGIPAEVAETLIYFASMAADFEAMRPGPASRIRNPDGSAQRETEVERTKRIVTAGVLHLVEIGLLVVPDDFTARQDDYFPLSREDST